ncbi:MAG TPA: hypothetical protein VGG75_13560 [Trebonia sp.]|jgi:hypothetical protein
MTLSEIALAGIALVVGGYLFLPRNMPRGYGRYVVTCMTLSAVAIGFAFYAMRTPATGPVTPYSYRTHAVISGQTLTCTMDVDSYGNGSLNECSAS